jgi:hypothetical protein
MLPIYVFRASTALCQQPECSFLNDGIPITLRWFRIHAPRTVPRLLQCPCVLAITDTVRRQKILSLVVRVLNSSYVFRYVTASFLHVSLIAQQPLWAQASPSWFHVIHLKTPQSVGLLWTRDQPVAETSTWQHTILTSNLFFNSKECYLSYVFGNFSSSLLFHSDTFLRWHSTTRTQKWDHRT